jgi:hypothetical protein
MTIIGGQEDKREIDYSPDLRWGSSNLLPSVFLKNPI